MEAALAKHKMIRQWERELLAMGGSGKELERDKGAWEESLPRLQYTHVRNCQVINLLPIK